ncbi:hypothetical protein OSTOST_06594 [Ostertagia ostertagi]
MKHGEIEQFCKERLTMEEGSSKIFNESINRMYGEYRFALALNEQKAFKGFLDQAVVKAFKNYVWHEWP